MSAPCTQEVGRIVRRLGNAPMDRFTTPAWCTWAITGRMYAVCDEYGCHSFKSDVTSAQTMDARSDVDEEKKISGQNSETINIWMHVVFLHAHGVGSVYTACLVLLDPSCQTDDANLILRITNGPERNYPRWWQRMEIHAQHVHISGFFPPFCYCQCLYPYGQRCSDTHDGLFGRRVVSVYNVYLILCMIEPVIDIRLSSSVKHIHNMHLSRRLHRSTSDGLLMVPQRKGALKR